MYNFTFVFLFVYMFVTHRSSKLYDLFLVLSYTCIHSTHCACVCCAAARLLPACALPNIPLASACTNEAATRDKSNFDKAAHCSRNTNLRVIRWSTTWGSYLPSTVAAIVLRPRWRPLRPITKRFSPRLPCTNSASSPIFG